VAEISITRMLLVVVLVFGICYFFEFLRQILVFSKYFDPNEKYDAYIINHLSSLFYVLNSSVNFTIYLLMVQKFRDRFYQIFCRPCDLTKSSIARSTSDGVYKVTVQTFNPNIFQKQMTFQNI